jgi:DNA-binding HxlR family transcriptional regulator
MKDTPSCSIERTLSVVGERWTFLVLREVLSGRTRFAEIRDVLGVAPDMLSARLAGLVEHGVLAREPYQEPGRRTRYAYRLTPAGRDLAVVLGALQQWGDDYLPRPSGPSVLRRRRDTSEPLHVGFVGDDGREVGLDEVQLVRSAAYPAAGPAARTAAGPDAPPAVPPGPAR